jgi:hypothetical protein
MAASVRQAFIAIWRPVFDASPLEDAALQTAWSRTRDLLAALYGPALTGEQALDLLAEMALAWLLRAMGPAASAEDTEVASLAQQAALALGALTYDLTRVYEGYFRLLRTWGVYR